MGGQPATPPPLASDQSPTAGGAGLPGPPPPSRAQPRSFPGHHRTAPAATTPAPGLGIPGLTPTVRRPPRRPEPRHPWLWAPACFQFTPTVPAAAPTTGPAGSLPQRSSTCRNCRSFSAVAAADFAARRPDLIDHWWGPGFSCRRPSRSPPVSAPVTSPNPLLFPCPDCPDPPPASAPCASRPPHHRRPGRPRNHQESDQRLRRRGHRVQCRSDVQSECRRRPAAPQPIPAQQLPGLPALTELSPIIQQAAGNPSKRRSY